MISKKGLVTGLYCVCLCIIQVASSTTSSNGENITTVSPSDREQNPYTTIRPYVTVLACVGAGIALTGILAIVIGLKRRFSGKNSQQSKYRDRGDPGSDFQEFPDFPTDVVPSASAANAHEYMDHDTVNFDPDPLSYDLEPENHDPDSANINHSAQDSNKDNQFESSSPQNQNETLSGINNDNVTYNESRKKKNVNKFEGDEDPSMNDKSATPNNGDASWNYGFDVTVDDGSDGMEMYPVTARAVDVDWNT